MIPLSRPGPFTYIHDEGQDPGIADGQGRLFLLVRGPMAHHDGPIIAAFLNGREKTMDAKRQAADRDCAGFRPVDLWSPK